MKANAPRKHKSDKSSLFFCEKLALKPDDESEDILKIIEFPDDPSIREVIRDLEGKIIGKRINFSEVKPKNPSVKKWINLINDTYPEIEKNTVEDLLNTFRDSLYPRSKEKNRIIVGIFLLKDIILLVHCKKDPSIAEWDGNIYPVKIILHPKNILRVSIIKKENGTLTFAAFEYSRKWSKGHADFWGIDPDDVNWEALGNIILHIDLADFNYPIQLAIESEELDEMLQEDQISNSGLIKIGRIDGKITSVDVFRRNMDFPEFYDFYITQKEQLEAYRKKFDELIKSGVLQSYDESMKNKYRYKEEEDKILEITTNGEKPIYQKKHPRYTICFFTNQYPRIVPSNKLITNLYSAIFDNHQYDIWHAGEETSQNPVNIGSLDIYNNCNIPSHLYELSERLLNVISDIAGKKEKYILQYHFCELWKNNLHDKHLHSMFDFIEHLRVIPDINYEYKKDGLFTKENHLEFKSSTDFNPKFKRFVDEKLIPTINSYFDGETLTRHCILYGIEDDNTISPISHLKNDTVTNIEKYANSQLNADSLQIKAYPLPVPNGIILLILLIPIIK
jgi:hypothetical protein